MRQVSRLAPALSPDTIRYVQGKLPLSGLSITKPDIDTETRQDCFDISGR